jgi:protein-L-isoaspartate(D-aspartate) O-methyltransferase
MEDSFRHKGLRHQLVECLRLKGIHDEKVLLAIEAVPRHFFFDSSFLEFAYQDKPFPIGAGQTISQPYTVAFQSELLNIKKGDKVLEIGTGSGYQACILCELGAKVFSIERQKLLFDKAKTFIPTLGYRVKTFYGDGYLGQPAFAPFDKIIITAGAPYIPEALVQQLKIGGILVAPIGNTDIQEMTTLVKLTGTSTRITSHGRFRFVPMLTDKATDK